MSGADVGSDGTGFWDRMASRGPATVEVGGVRLGAGSRVRLRPRRHSDILDLALDGRTAVVEAVEQDDEGRVHLAVTVADDPGRDLGDARMPGHRFFYAVEDVQPLEPGLVPDGGRVLVAGIGNMFLGDDGFGCEVARRLADGPVIPGADVVDFGIRGMDLAYALLREYRAAILVDASPRGYAPGTLTVLRPRPPAPGSVDLRTHGMDPARVLALARELGGVPAETYVLCCEPESVPVAGPDEEVVVALSGPVCAALDAAVGMVRSLVAELLAQPDGKAGEDSGGEAREEDAVGRGPGGRGHGDGDDRAVAGNPAVHEDAADVTAALCRRPGAVPGAPRGGRSAGHVPGHTR